MSVFSCWWWWLITGGLLGWLASWWLSRGTLRRTIESWSSERAGLISQHTGALRAKEADLTRLQSDVLALKSRPPQVVEKIVERPVDRVVEKTVEKPVDRFVERIVEKPVTIRQTVDRVVDNPALLARIRELEAQIASIAGLKSTNSQLESTPPKVSEKVVEKAVDNPAHLQRIRELEDRLALLDAQVDRAAAGAAGFSVRGMNDLEIIEGIGPKIAALLNNDGVFYFRELAAMDVAKIKAILDKGGPRFALAKPDTWPEQAALAAKNQWDALRRLQDELVAGNRKSSRGEAT